MIAPRNPLKDKSSGKLTVNPPPNRLKKLLILSTLIHKNQNTNHPKSDHYLTGLSTKSLRLSSLYHPEYQLQHHQESKSSPKLIYAKHIANRFTRTISVLSVPVIFYVKPASRPSIHRIWFLHLGLSKTAKVWLNSSWLRR